MAYIIPAVSLRKSWAKKEKKVQHNHLGQRILHFFSNTVYSVYFCQVPSRFVPFPPPPPFFDIGLRQSLSLRQRHQRKSDLPAFVSFVRRLHASYHARLYLHRITSVFFFFYGRYFSILLFHFTYTHTPA